MSFSSGIKEDLVRIRLKNRSQRLSQLAGLTVACGALYLGRGGRGVQYATESLAAGKQAAALAGELYALDAEIELREQEQRKNPLAIVTLTGADAERLTLDTGLLAQSREGLSVPEGVRGALVNDEEDRRAFLRGMFLGCGSCSNPARGYHLELVVRSQTLAVTLCRLIATFGPYARVHRRKDRHIVYLKGEEVSGFLALIGAGAAALSFENVRAEREFRNYVNRKNNCDTANIGKTVDASLAQLHAIETIERTMDLGRLPTPLYEAAMLRLSHPDATLQELAELAEIGKSGMNHRLSRLLKMAKEIEDG